MILKGAVLIPNIHDTSGDILDEKTIRKAELEIGRNKGILIDVQHKLRSVGRLIGLYTTDSPITFNGNQYPKGTLFCSVEVTDEVVENMIRDGKLTGFSIMAAPKLTPEQIDRGLK